MTHSTLLLLMALIVSQFCTQASPMHNAASYDSIMQVGSLPKSTIAPFLFPVIGAEPEDEQEQAVRRVQFFIGDENSRSSTPMSFKNTISFVDENSKSVSSNPPKNSVSLMIRVIEQLIVSAHSKRLTVDEELELWVQCLKSGVQPEPAMNSASDSKEDRSWWVKDPANDELWCTFYVIDADTLNQLPENVITRILTGCARHYMSILHFTQDPESTDKSPLISIEQQVRSLRQVLKIAETGRSGSFDPVPYEDRELQLYNSIEMLDVSVKGHDLLKKLGNLLDQMTGAKRSIVDDGMVQLEIWLDEIRFDLVPGLFEWVREEKETPFYPVINAVLCRTIRLWRTVNWAKELLYAAQPFVIDAFMSMKEELSIENQSVEDLQFEMSIL